MKATGQYWHALQRHACLQCPECHQSVPSSMLCLNCTFPLVRPFKQLFVGGCKLHTVNPAVTVLARRR